MNNQERRLPDCPFPHPELWVDFILAEFKSAGSYKSMHLRKTQKKNLFLAFKLRNETIGVFPKIAKHLGMYHTNLIRMVQNSKIMKNSTKPGRFLELFLILLFRKVF